MIHHINIGGEDRPLTLTYSVPWQYELETGRYYNQDVTELCVEILRAGDEVNKARKNFEQQGEPKSNVDQMIDLIRIANGSAGFSMVRFIDIFYVSLAVGHRKSGVPFPYTKTEIADMVMNEGEVVEKFTLLLLQANFKLKLDDPGEAEPDESATDDTAKKKSPALLTGTNS